MTREIVRISPIASLSISVIPRIMALVSEKSSIFAWSAFSVVGGDLRRTPLFNKKRTPKKNKRAFFAHSILFPFQISKISIAYFFLGGGEATPTGIVNSYLPIDSDYLFISVNTIVGKVFV